jgi:hypothetical protein
MYGKSIAKTVRTNALALASFRIGELRQTGASCTLPDDLPSPMTVDAKQVSPSVTFDRSALFNERLDHRKSCRI